MFTNTITRPAEVDTATVAEILSITDSMLLAAVREGKVARVPSGTPQNRAWSRGGAVD